MDSTAPSMRSGLILSLGVVLTVFLALMLALSDNLQVRIPPPSTPTAEVIAAAPPRHAHAHSAAAYPAPAHDHPHLDAFRDAYEQPDRDRASPGGIAEMRRATAGLDCLYRAARRHAVSPGPQHGHLDCRDRSGQLPGGQPPDRRHDPLLADPPLPHLAAAGLRRPASFLAALRGGPGRYTLRWRAAAPPAFPRDVGQRLSTRIGPADPLSAAAAGYRRAAIAEPTQLPPPPPPPPTATA